MVDFEQINVSLVDFVRGGGYLRREVVSTKFHSILKLF